MPCVDSTKGESYLNLPEVKSAIHVKSGIYWTICTDQIDYNSNTQSVIPIYKELIKNKIRILVYSGNTDASVPFVGSQKWTSSLQLPRKSLWREWLVDQADGSQIAGYVTEYSGLTFATIKGAGHMVPQFRPIPAFYMFKKFINGEDL